MTLFITKTPILANTDHTNDILNNLPIGIVILDKDIIDLQSGFKISFANLLGKKLLGIPKDNDIKKFKTRLESFKECNPLFPSLVNSNKNLFQSIFDSYPFETNKTFQTPSENYIYVKIKYYNSKILITVDNYNDERQGLQNKYLQSIGYEYLLTLYHEINNPLNSLIGTANEIGFLFENKCQSESKRKRIDLLVFLIRFFLKNFILYFQLSGVNKTEIMNNDTTVNLEHLFHSISGKFSKVFAYKQIVYCENLFGLKLKNITMNYFYFKNLIKMIYNYFYHVVEKGGNFNVTVEELSLEKQKIKVIFTNGKSSEIIGKAHSSFSENDKINSRAKCLVKTVQMTEEIIKKISNLLNIKLDFSNEGQVVYIALFLKVRKDEEFGTDMELNELTPNHPKKLINVNRNFNKISLAKLKKANISRTENSDPDYKEKKLFDFSFTSNDKDLRGQMNGNVCYPSSKKSSFLYSMIKSLRKTSLNSDITSQNDFSRKINIINFRSITHPNFQNQNNSMIEKKRVDLDDTPVEKGKRYTKYNSTTEKKMVNGLKSIYDNFQTEKKSSSSETQSNGSCEVDSVGDQNHAFVSVNVKPPDYKTLRQPKKKKRTDFVNGKVKHFEKIRTELTKPAIKDSFKTVVGSEVHSLSLSGCNCRDVLIVDDEQFNVCCLSNMLKKMNIKSDLCYNGIECVEKIKQKLANKCTCSKSQYKLILMDLLMPKMDGMEATEKIQQMCDTGLLDPKTISIVYISACVDKEKDFKDIQKKYPIVKEFVHKPVKKSKIESILQTYYYPIEGS